MTFEEWFNVYVQIPDIKDDMRFAFEAGRKAGIEEAARVAESYEPRCDVCPSGVTNAIRALVEKGT